MVNEIIGINLGCGLKWKLGNWGGADEEITGERLDSKTIFPYKENSLKFAYSSHFFEHVDNIVALNLFNETYRVLQPGGTFRVTVPSISALANKFKSNDVDFFEKTLKFEGRPEWQSNGVEPNICSYFLHFISNFDKVCNGKLVYRGGPNLPSEEVMERVLTDNFEKFFTWVQSHVPKSTAECQVFPQHINYWTEEKFRDFGKNQNWSRIIRQKHNVSSEDYFFNNRHLFDSFNENSEARKHWTIYMEFIK